MHGFYQECTATILPLMQGVINIDKLFVISSGEVIISGGKDGLMAVSSPRTGITIRIISDHKGSPITTIECTQKRVRFTFKKGYGIKFRVKSRSIIYFK